MRPSKAISTAAYWINLGISQDRYYTLEPSKSLKTAKCYWNGDVLILEVAGEQHRFQYLGRDK
jgi:hypothetical protein